MVWLQLISRNRGTVAYAPCFGYDLCRRRANATQIAELDLSSWRVAGVGAEMIDPQVIERFCEAFAPAGFRQGAVLASYGLAEATLGVTFAPRDRGLETDRVDPESLGRHRRAVISNDPGAAASCAAAARCRARASRSADRGARRCRLASRARPHPRRERHAGLLRRPRGDG
jgi:fatty-acyl-CoA synthase